MAGVALIVREFRPREQDRAHQLLLEPQSEEARAYDRRFDVLKAP
jgi:hypothetical protein